MSRSQAHRHEVTVELPPLLRLVLPPVPSAADTGLEDELLHENPQVAIVNDTLTCAYLGSQPTSMP